jgi:amino acid adenylation domain-containing protein
MTPSTGFRLSAEQERVWIQHVEQNTLPWTECEVLLEGRLETSRLHQTIRNVVGRHEILRTVFHQQRGLKVPFQVILDDAPFAWQTVDLSALEPCAQRTNLQAHISEQRDVLSLEDGPTLTILLATLAPETYVLILGLPALCSDLQSMWNLIAKIGRSYAVDVEENAETAEVLQYADLVEWQVELLADEDTRRGREFWRNYCRTLDFESMNPDMPCSGTKSGAGFAPGFVVREIQTSLFDQMTKVFSSHGASMADGLLACWHVFLSRIAGQPTITIGCEADGRTHEELKDALGLFAKYLPIQFTIDRGLPFCALLEQTKSCVAEALSWQDSFAWTHMKPSEGEDHSARLALGFDYAEFPSGQFHSGIKFTALREQGWPDLFKIRLSARRKAGALTLEFHYDAAQLERATVERWSDDYLTMLAAAVDHPDACVGRLPLLSVAERRRVLVEWNRTEAEYPRERCIHDLFEEQVVRTPDRAAVRCEDRQLSYRELNEQANRLAHYLRYLGVGANGLVGLCLDRGIEMIVGLLAILKAGGAYVPLSADNPKARLAQQLSGTIALIAGETLIGDVPEFGGRIIRLERDMPSWSKEPHTNPKHYADAENLSYVIYTSGSTGVPKGVAVRHRNLVNYTWFVSRLLNLNRHSGGLHFGIVSTLSADLGNTCIFPSLISGGCLHVIPFEVSTDSKRFREYTSRHAIDVLKIVPSHLAALLDDDSGKESVPRKYLITGGESLTLPLVEKVRALRPDCEIINHYGPTETTIGSLTLRLAEYDWNESAGRSIPIGRPIANTRVYILDAQRELVPIGVAGELYISGAGVTAGYINQPERTAERFFVDCFNDDRGEKMYRTGDLARYLPDGTVEFLGRADDQVKIRGFRFELGEVESVLARHAGVKQIVVVAKPDERGDRRLIAYVVTNQDSLLPAETLRAYLREHLPEYMVPAAIVFLPRLPLTSNGKIDRQNLPDPAQISTHAEVYVAPRSSTEAVVAGIWAEVLRLDRVGVKDNFFQIGGHSLLATQVISRIRRSLNVNPPLRVLFESPTVAALAEAVDRMQGQNQGLITPPITSAPREQALPLSFGQQRLWIVSQLEPNSCRYSVPRAIRLTGSLNSQALEKALNDVVQRHEVLRTTYSADRGRPVQVIAQKVSVALPVQDLSGLSAADSEEEASRILRAQAEKPFDLEKDTIFRAQLLKLGPEDHILFLNTHHIASDGWSFWVLQRDLAAFYRAALAGASASLPELPIQYADYAVWQRNWMQGDVLKKQLAYWRSRLKGAPPLFVLPTDRPRPAVQTLRGGVHHALLPNSLADPIRALSRQEGATVFMTMLAAFQCLILHYSNQPDIVLGTDVAGRSDVRTEDLIGFFVNLLVLRTNLSGDPSFKECISRVRETALGAYSHQDVPFDRIVEELRPKRSRAYYPLVQVLFAQRNTPQGTSTMNGVEASTFKLECKSVLDMYVSFADITPGFACVWVYNSDLFDASTVAKMAGLYQTTLEKTSANPAMRLSELIPLLIETERQEREKEQTRFQEASLQQPKNIDQSSKVHTDLSWAAELAASSSSNGLLD